ncbi:MAG: hypothetical protein ACP5TY_11400 [Thermodesulforhabdaceae bacterium]|jgi:hypothetical protein
MNQDSCSNCQDSSPGGFRNFYESSLKRRWVERYRKKFITFAGKEQKRPDNEPSFLIIINANPDNKEVKIHFEHDQQRVSESGQGWGRNCAIDITIKGAGTENPTIEVDWDVFYSSR